MREKFALTQKSSKRASLKNDLGSYKMASASEAAPFRINYKYNKREKGQF